MKRYNNTGKSVWGQNRQDSYQVNRFGSRPQFGGHRDGGGSYRPPGEDGDFESRPSEEPRQDDRVNSKLDQVLKKLEQWDVWKEEAGRRFDSLQIGDDVVDDQTGNAGRRKRTMEGGFPQRNPNLDFTDGPPEGRARRGERGRPASDWGFHGDRQSGFNRPATFWDPPQRYKSNISNYEKPPRVKMHPPRFNGSDATKWVSRVQHYFDHVMMPDAERLHYAVMLFDPPAAEWVFNYCANNEFVTWQEFLEDVRRRFDRQSFQDYFGLIAKLTQTGSVVEYHDTFEIYLNRVQGIPERQLFTLFVAGLKPDMQERLRLHRPSSLAAAMALTLELADSHGDRQRPWHVRDTRIQAGPVSRHPPTQNILDHTPQPAQGRVANPSRHPQVRVSQAEKAERAKMSLCYYCPDKWVIGHVCKQRLLCYADDSDDVDDVDLEMDMTEDLADREVAHVPPRNPPEINRLKLFDSNDISSDDDPSIIEINQEQAKNKKQLIKVGPELSDEDDEKIGEDNEETLLDDKEESGCIDKGIKPGLGTYSSSLDGACRYNHGEVIENVLSSMAQKGLILRSHALVYGLVNKKLCGVGETFAMDLSLKRACIANAELEHATYECMFMALLCEGRHSTVRYVFDPGGYASPKLSTIVVASRFPP